VRAQLTDDDDSNEIIEIYSLDISTSGQVKGNGLGMLEAGGEAREIKITGWA
jgi:hypothetical protein